MNPGRDSPLRRRERRVNLEQRTLGFRKQTRTMLLAATALVAAALLLPFAVNVNRFRGQIVDRKSVV